MLHGGQRDTPGWSNTAGLQHAIYNALLHTDGCRIVIHVQQSAAAHCGRQARRRPADAVIRIKSVRLYINTNIYYDDHFLLHFPWRACTKSIELAPEKKCH